MNKVFSKYSQYYDLLYKDKDYHKEVDYIDSIIKNYSPETKEILEFGSGTGIHGKLLVKKGYKVVGIERSHEMISLSRDSSNNEHPFECIEGDICKLNLNRQFDVVISLFHVVSYQTKNDELIAVFRNANRHLKEKGLFVFDAWYTPAVYVQKPEIRLKRIEDSNISVIRIAEPCVHYNDNVVDVNYSIIIKDKLLDTVGEIKETHPMRHFSLKEIDLISEFTGFRVVKSEEFLSGNPVSEKTWGVCFVLEKEKK